MNWLDVKYILLLSGRLENFKKKGKAYNFRCPICGDSKDNRKKSRGYLIEKNRKTYFYCHNEGCSMSFEKFLNHLDTTLYDSYILEKLTERNVTQFKAEEVIEKVLISNEDIIKGLKKVSQLPITHPVRKYISQRKIPSKFHYKIYYASKFKRWVNSIIPNKFENIEHDEPRLVFALIDQNKNIFGINARSLTGTEPKYITIKFDESKPKIFGLDDLDSSKDIFVFEGPIDSMMINNGIATCGGSLRTEVSQLNIDKEKFVLVFDNEPRKPATVKQIERAIQDGYRVVLLNDVDKKDANGLICEGMTSHDYKTMLRSRTFKGMEAELEFGIWRKI